VKSRIALRIFAFNALLVFLPVAAFSLLGSYERGLVDSLEQALAQQARITAAWLGQGRFDSASATRALAAIGSLRTARFRVVDSEGRLLADSSDIEAAPALSAAAASPRDAPSFGAVATASSDDGEPILYRLFSAPARIWRRFFAPPEPPFSSADYYAAAGPRLLGVEVQEALKGRYGAATRVSSGGQVSVTLYSAVPVYARGSVVGAVLVSQSTYRILRDLYAIRLDISRIFLGSLVAAAALSMLLALTIVGPLKRLSRAASLALAGSGALAAAFPESARGDEIGDLQRSLRGLASSLDERIRQTERFAADAAHEFRNPLAAIRSAAELAELASDQADRSRFHKTIVEDTDRLRAITDGLRRLSLAEGRIDPASLVVLDATEVADKACARARSRCALEGRELLIGFTAEAGKTAPCVMADPAAFDIVLDNLLDNAASFARSRVRVCLRFAPGGRALEIIVEDDGPGIPPEHLGRVFDRFFTWRPGEDKARHTGLGLSLAFALARSLGGKLEAGNCSRPLIVDSVDSEAATDAEAFGGARFTLGLPLASAR
jgi:two-component system, OmpR family, sensor histidine kinase ChvG